MTPYLLPASEIVNLKDIDLPALSGVERVELLTHLFDHKEQLGGELFQTIVCDDGSAVGRLKIKISKRNEQFEVQVVDGNASREIFRIDQGSGEVSGSDPRRTNGGDLDRILWAVSLGGLSYEPLATTDLEFNALLQLHSGSKAIDLEELCTQIVADEPKFGSNLSVRRAIVSYFGKLLTNGDGDNSHQVKENYFPAVSRAYGFTVGELIIPDSRSEFQPIDSDVRRFFEELKNVPHYPACGFVDTEIRGGNPAIMPLAIKRLHEGLYNDSPKFEGPLAFHALFHLFRSLSDVMPDRTDDIEMLKRINQILNSAQDLFQSHSHVDGVVFFGSWLRGRQVTSDIDAVIFEENWSGRSFPRAVSHRFKLSPSFDHRPYELLHFGSDGTLDSEAGRLPFAGPYICILNDRENASLAAFSRIAQLNTPRKVL